MMLYVPFLTSIKCHFNYKLYIKGSLHDSDMLFYNIVHKKLDSDGVFVTDVTVSYCYSV